MKIAIALTILLLMSAIVPAQDKLNHAVDLYRAGKYSEAVDELKKLNSTDEASYKSFPYIGASLARMGKNDEAREAFARADKAKIVKNPESGSPVKILKRGLAKSNGVPSSYSTGRVLLALELNSDKTVGLFFVIQSTAEEYTRNCIEAAKKIKFEPATSNGKPVSVINLFEYSFKRN